jgi:hypothetical protein
MPRRSHALVALLPLLAACADGESTAPMTARSASGPALSVGAERPRPAGGACKGNVAALPPVAGDPANLARLRIDFTCRFKHLGRTTASVEHLVFFTGPTTGITSHVTRWRAANGDELHATWAGTATFDGPYVYITGTETFTGGTGRFAGATGSQSAKGKVSQVTSVGELTFVGTLSY